jgi:hypothetical protein
LGTTRSGRQTGRVWSDGDTERARRGGGMEQEHYDRTPDHTQPHCACLLRLFSAHTFAAQSSPTSLSAHRRYREDDD